MIKQKVEILRTAEGLFLEKGINQCKMEDIAQRLKMSKKTIYKHFRNKDELILSVFYPKFEIMNQNMDEIVGSKRPFLEKLLLILYTIRKNLSGITPQVARDLRAGYPEMVDKASNYVENATFNRFQNLIEEGFNSGLIKDDVVKEYLILQYRDTLKNFLLLSSSTDLPERVDVSYNPAEHLLQNLQTLFRGILTQEAIVEYNDMVRGKIQNESA